TFNHQFINTNLTYSGISSPCNDGDGFFLAFVTLAEFKNVVFMALLKRDPGPVFYRLSYAQALAQRHVAGRRRP
ncbi:hypothetical protein QUH12_11700, partial [Klebsiella pneumoniae]|nr:hypothetical protein [Klebsiella pneumoniae]